jgi:hypothetical protein
MAEKEDRGKLNAYNEIPVKMRDYYYDAYSTDSNIKDTFDDMAKDLNDVNDKLKKELENGKNSKLKTAMKTDVKQETGKGKDINKK